MARPTAEPPGKAPSRCSTSSAGGSNARRWGGDIAVRWARRVGAAYRPDGPGSVSPMEAMGRVYPMFGAVFGDAEARAFDDARLADGTLVDLGIGRYFPPDTAVIDAALDALRSGHTRYLDPDALKTALAANYSDEPGVR